MPFGALIPAEADGLLAAEKNIAVSRMASGATRLQPITMLTDQAVGALAALAIQQGIAPRQVDPTQLQVTLLQAGIILASPPMTDMPLGTLPWQAAQFAVTHEWMEASKDGKFHPEAMLTRAEFVRMVQVLEARKHPGIPTEILNGNMRPEDAEPISRGEAAMVLYAAVKVRAAPR